MYTVYESKLNRKDGEPIIERTVNREDAKNFSFAAEGDKEQIAYSKSCTFRNRSDAEKQNEILATMGRTAAVEFAKTIENREAKKGPKKMTACAGTR
jgi:hypothetical protein